jgi:hypothetical protein
MRRPVAQRGEQQPGQHHGQTAQARHQAMLDQDEIGAYG